MVKVGDMVKAVIVFKVESLSTDKNGTIVYGDLRAADGAYVCPARARLDDCEVINAA